MSFGDKGSKGLQDLNYDQRDARKRANDGIVTREQRPITKDDWRSDAKDFPGGTFPQVPPQQQLKGSTVCWERFLHLRSLKVLLVENDDSTRHVLTALLRNCSYEVIEAADELQAWKILEDLTNHIDLVLTEVVVPCLSGIGLLCKIMNHKTRKNLPVIMMSSHDSMVLVFKCLSKGAVDFLVKPIRKNELKNLWQHVWRRCHSANGSGSQSGTQTKKSIRSKSGEESNDGGSNGGEENGSVGLNLGNGSDNGSGTQSSWRKQAVEVESHKKLPLQHQTGKPHDCTFPPIIHPNAETDGKQLVWAVASEESREHKRKTEFLSLKEQAEDADVQNKRFYEVDLSLRGLKGSTSLQDDQNVLRRSDSSAFSRYNSALNVNNNKAFNFLHNSSTGIAVHNFNNVRSKSSGNNDIDTGYRIGNAFFMHLSSNAQQAHPLSACHPVKCELSREPVEGKMDNFTINRSTSGANHFTEVNTESDHGVSGFIVREIENKSALREAALIKFRQKRKERCFQKKVRYQSRQKLAEQRPRVKGQFAKLAANEAEKVSEN